MSDDPNPTVELADVGDIADVVAALRALTAALAGPLTPATRPAWDQLRWSPDAEAFGAAAPRTAVLPSGLPGNVVANELIESAWGNAVADALAKMGAVISVDTPAAIVNPSPGAPYQYNWPTIPLPVAPFTGTAMVTITQYLGFTTAGSVTNILFCDAVTSPAGQAWVAESAAVNAAANQWCYTPTLTIPIPTLKGAVPIVGAGFRFTMGACFAKALIGCQFMPGTMPALLAPGTTPAQLDELELEALEDGG